MSTVNFEFAFPRMLQHEGGLVDHPADPGGLTNLGISFRFLRGLPSYRHMSDADLAQFIRELTPDQAKPIYFEHFWRAWYDGIPPTMSYQLFDMAVNAGHRTAHRCLQRALRAVGFYLVPDGIAGRKTRQALRECLDNGINPLFVYRSERAAYYRVLAEKRPAMQAFLRGWLTRAYGL